MGEWTETFQGKGKGDNMMFMPEREHVKPERSGSAEITDIMLESWKNAVRAVANVG